MVCFLFSCVRVVPAYDDNTILFVVDDERVHLPSRNRRQPTNKELHDIFIGHSMDKYIDI
jgi:hypothetical protein